MLQTLRHQISLTDLKPKIGSNTVTVGGFNIPPSSICRSFLPQKPTRHRTLKLSDITHQKDLADICLPPKLFKPPQRLQCCMELFPTFSQS